MAGSNSNRRYIQQKQNKKKESPPHHRSINRTGCSTTVHDSSSTTSTWSPNQYTALKVLLSARLCSAVWGIITDCDETYNYWEPSHYLLYGWGYQTWEYAPQYALRSYFYLMLYAVPAWIYDALISSSRVMVFFFVRCLLAVFSSFCELYFYKGVLAAYGGAVARAALCLLVFSAGMFSAATAFLPSSFAMQAVCVCMGAWLQGQQQLAVLCMAVAAIVGWPFVAAIGLPVAYDILLRKGNFSMFVKWSLFSAAVILLPMVSVDSSYYGRLVVAPLNLVLYNVFSSHGPNLYGTEPWTYYLVNGFLNFNVAFLLALMALPLQVLRPSAFIGHPVSTNNVAPPPWLSLSPLYLWLAVFVVQPHKEERFLYPVYPLVCLAAAVAIEHCRGVVAALPWRPASRRARHVAVAALLLSSSLSVSRILAQYRGYHAPLDVFLSLQQQQPAASSSSGVATTRVCLGKEWHRFPSSFFLPDRWEMRFIKSAFAGQLPQPYLRTTDAAATHRDNFNELNTEETDRYVSLDSCHYLVDRDTPDDAGPLEPRYSQRVDSWKTVLTVPFLDASRSPQLLRAFYVPFLTESSCTYSNYSLLQRVPRATRPVGTA